MSPPLKTNGNSGSSSDSPPMKLLKTDDAAVKLQSDGDTTAYMVAVGAVCRMSTKCDTLSAKWFVETVPGTNTIRLKNPTFGGSKQYLTAAAGGLVLSKEIAPGSTWKPSENKQGVRLESEKPGFFLKANDIENPPSVEQYPPEDITTKAIRWLPVPLSVPSQAPGRVGK